MMPTAIMLFLCVIKWFPIHFLFHPHTLCYDNIFLSVFNDVGGFFPARSVKFLDCTDKLAEKDSGEIFHIYGHEKVINP